MGNEIYEKTIVIDIPEGMTPDELGYEEDDGSLGEADETAEVIVNFTKE